MLLRRMLWSAAMEASRAGGVDGLELLLVGVKGGDLLLDVRGGVVLELGVVLVEAGLGAGGGGEVEVDVGEVLVGDEAEGLDGAVGGEVLGGCWG